MKNLITYLSTHGYPHQLTPKSIQKPSVKDFANIVIFLFNQADKNMSLKGKFEDDVVNVFKQFKYQHNISKQNLAAPGTPHTWPTLLGTLHWLVDLLVYCDNSAVEVNPVQEYIFRSYDSFNKGDDAHCAALFEEFVSKIRSENEDINQEVANIEAETQDLVRDNEEIERVLASYPAVQRKLSDYKSDYSKFQQLIAELTNHQQQLESKLRQREVEVEEVDVSIAQVQKEIAMLQNRIANQSISAKEAEAMRAQQATLMREHEVTAAKHKEIQEKVFVTEDALRNAVSHLEHTSAEYNSAVDRLPGVTSSVKKQLSITVDIRYVLSFPEHIVFLIMNCVFQSEKEIASDFDGCSQPNIAHAP